jgi:hypothetical protein
VGKMEIRRGLWSVVLAVIPETPSKRAHRGLLVRELVFHRGGPLHYEGSNSPIHI